MLSNQWSHGFYITLVLLICCCRRHYHVETYSSLSFLVWVWLLYQYVCFSRTKCWVQVIVRKELIYLNVVCSVNCKSYLKNYLCCSVVSMIAYASLAYLAFKYIKSIFLKRYLLWADFVLLCLIFYVVRHFEPPTVSLSLNLFIYSQTPSSAHLLTEGDALKLIRLLLPPLNSILLKMGEIFSGEPTVTLKVLLDYFCIPICLLKSIRDVYTTLPSTSYTTWAYT